ncbi:MAG: glycosyltransferase [Rhodobacteraceae bacterium]|nr:glycosyltransferase [Paracoccaceae bacterium]
MRVLILVTHLLGTGHFSRALTLGKAFCDAGHDVELVSGGTQVPNLPSGNVRLHQLAPVKSDGVNFTCLLDASGQRVDETYMLNRQKSLVAVLNRIQPDVLITELYPFGRRVLKSEFLAVLETAKNLHSRPKTLSSIRDILAPPSTPQKALDTASLISRYYDAVLVHSDPTATPLEASWPVTEALSEKLIYTGYVAPPLPASHPEKTGQGEILVTAGGGNVGMALFEAAVEAAKRDQHHQWRLLVGGSDKEARIRRLSKRAGTAGIKIESVRPDFRQMLSHAAASVSMCGYNTAIDLLQTQTPGVFVPFDLGGEVEQTLRAESLAGRQGYSVVPSNKLTPEILLKEVQGVMKEGASDIHSQFDGGAESVRIVQRMVEAG